MPAIDFEALNKFAESLPTRQKPPAARKRAQWSFRAVMTELARRKLEGLELYLPLPHAVPFHASRAKWRIAAGSNRSSKTLSGAVEATRCWRGRDPFDKFLKHNGKALVIGLDWDHIGQMWRKCYLPGAFKIIRDEKTRLWRAVRPDPQNPRQLDPYDVAYREKWRDVPPLIPDGVVDVTWESKKQYVPRHAIFKETGWSVQFASSDGHPKKGEDYQFGWIDEQLQNAQFLFEMARGLVATNQPPKYWPKAIWTATSQEDNPELLELQERGSIGSESVESFLFLIRDNPYLPAEEVAAFEAMLSDEEREVRIEGKHRVLGRRIYSAYDPHGQHGVEPFDIPPTWARYVYLDPGRQHCGTIFLAVDPEEQHRWVYDGFDLRNADAHVWAEEVALRQRDDGVVFEAIVIDARMGQETPPGSGKCVAEQYWDALAAKGVQVRQRGAMHGFQPGCDKPLAREEALLNWIRIRPEGPFAGTPTLKVLRGRVPTLDKQLRFARYDSKKPDKRVKQTEDVLVCLEYAAAHEPHYVPPEKAGPTKTDPLMALWEKKQERKRGTRDSSGVVL